MAFKHRYPLILLFLTSALFHQKGIFEFLFLKEPAGFDLIGHYISNLIVYDSLKHGTILNWTNLWFAGMPIMIFYPPVFFILTAAITFISSGYVPLLISLKIIVFLSVFAIPFVFFSSMRKIGFKQNESFIISLWSFVYLFMFGVNSAVHQTLNLGLVAQMLAINFMTLLFGELLRHDEKSKILPAVLFSLTILTHVFIAALTFAGLIIYLIIKPMHLKRITFIFLLSVLISSPWLISVLSKMQYFEMYGSGLVDLNSKPFILIPFILSFLLFSKKDDKRILYFSLLSVMFLLLLLRPDISKIQYYRLPNYLLFFGSIIAGMGTIEASKLTFQFTKSRALCALLIMIPLIAVIATPVKTEWESKINTSNLIEWINENTNNGRILIESNYELKEDYYTLTENIPLKTGKQTLSKVHTDSSISALYVLIMEHEISEIPWDNPLCDICLNVSNKDADANLVLDHLRKFNVKYVIATNNMTKNHLKNFLVFRNNVDGFDIFEVPGKSEYYEIPKYKPILVIGNLKGKNSWQEFNKIIFLNKNLQNLTFVHGTKDDINSNFGGVILLNKIKLNSSLPTLIVSNLNKTDLEGEVEKLKTSYNQSVNITDFKFDNNTISFNINSSNRVPVILKFSYFPDWKGERIYLTNPSMMLIFGKGDIKMFFR